MENSSHENTQLNEAEPIEAEMRPEKSDAAIKATAKRHSWVMITVIIGLTAIVGIAALLNQAGIGSRLTLAENAEIVIRHKGEQVFVVTPKALEELGLTEFKASLNSDGSDPKQHTYTGIPLKDVLIMAGIALSGGMQVDILSVDGYRVALSAMDVLADHNVYLVTKDNGEFLGTIDDKNGRGPYMIVIRQDPFSQRWSKYVCEIDTK